MKKEQKKPQPPRKIDTRINLGYRPGLRVYKTILAVMICMGISLFINTTADMSIAVVSAIVALRVSQEETIRTSLYRVVGTLLGGALGLLCVALEPYIPYYHEGVFVIAIPLMMLLAFYLCNVLRLKDAAVISVTVVFLVSMRVDTGVDAGVGNALPYAAERVLQTLIGVSVATMVNILFFPRRSRKELHEIEHSGEGETTLPAKENAETARVKAEHKTPEHAKSDPPVNEQKKDEAPAPETRPE